MSEDSGWFAVRCVFRTNWPPTESSSHCYEERITLWRTANADEAIALAEAEATEYAAALEEAPDEYLGFAQSYALLDVPNQNGAEVFSLMRDSDLEPEDYLDAFFSSGREHVREVPAGGGGPEGIEPAPPGHP